MNRILLTTFFIALTSFMMKLNAQSVGISAGVITPDASSMLEVQSTTKGILIPRVALTATNAAGPITLPATSLLVYNTATASAGATQVTPGYYYNAGTTGAPNWTRLLGGKDGWLTTGNYGTSVATNWLGTNDNVDFAIRTNNTERARILGAGNFLVNVTTAPLATAAFTSVVSPTFTTAIFGIGNGGTPIRAEQQDVASDALWAHNTAANGAGSGGAIWATSNQIGSSTLVVGLRSSSYYANNAISAIASVNTATAIYAVNNVAAGTSTGDGIYGQTGQSQGYGVWGANTHASGTGVVGAGNNQSSNYLVNGSGGAFTGLTTGCYGKANTVANGVGVVGVGNNVATGSTPVEGSGGAFTGVTYGVAGYATSSVDGSAGGYFTNGSGAYAYAGARNLATNYKVIGSGTVSTIVSRPDGSLTTLFCPEAPEILFQDYGSGQLVNGAVHIELDPVFANAIFVSEDYPLRVFIQLEGNCNGVYVDNKTKTGFDVIELQNGQSNVKFSWSVVANRADQVDKQGNIVSKHVGVRFPDGPGPLESKELETTTKENKKSELKEVKKVEPSQLNIKD